MSSYPYTGAVAGAGPDDDGVVGTRDHETSGAARRLRYQHVYDYVLELIAREKLKPGDRLPSAPELAERTGVSMISVRRGLAELEHEGKVSRHQGVGTFVGHGRIVTAPSHSGELLASLVGRTPRPTVRTELLGIRVGKASRSTAAALSIKVGEPVWEVRRLRHVGESASILERAVLPIVRVSVLDEAYLRTGKSMYAYLEREFGLRDAATEQAIEVDRPSSAERQVLKLGATARVVRIRGISFDADGVPFDCYEQVYGASNFVFYVASADRRELLEPTDMGEWLVEPLGGSGGR